MGVHATVFLALKWPIWLVCCLLAVMLGGCGGSSAGTFDDLLREETQSRGLQGAAASWGVVLAGLMGVAGVGVVLFRPRPQRRNTKTGSMMVIQHTREGDTARLDLIRQAEAFVRLHFMAQEICCELVARKLRVSSEYLARRFKQQTGQSMGAFVNMLRVEKSIQYLEEGAKSIGEVGHAVGFTSPDAYIRSFRCVKGVTPGEYRKRRKTLA